MPRRFLLCAALALGLLTTALPGCVSVPRMLGGSGDVTLVLDGEQAWETSLPQGRTLVLDMRDPGLSGYAFAGTSFDPALLRWDGLLAQPEGRVRYQFLATAKGRTDIQIKIRKDAPGYRPDVYKRVSVTIE